MLDATRPSPNVPYRPVLVSRQAARTDAGPLGYGLLYVPFFLAWGLAGSPLLSYGAAWLGSWWIMWFTMTGRAKALPGGGALFGQLMRPIGFTQAVFTGYMALTSIFLVLDLYGFAPGLGTGAVFEISDLAQVQRYYVLGHAGFATGVLALMQYNGSGTWRVNISMPYDTWMLWVAVSSLVVAVSIRFLPGGGQVAIRFQSVSLVASVLALAVAFSGRKGGSIAAGIALYAANLLQAVLSGWKEEIAVLLVLLGVFAYPTYRKTVLVLAPLAMAAFLLIVPTYNEIFRNLSWNEGVDSQVAAGTAVAVVQQSDTDALIANMWTFLALRSSEASLFTVYTTNTPAAVPFHGLGLAEQAVAMTLPRALWPQKPDVEVLVMQRVYDNGVTVEGADVSAKPQYVVDGYLSAGALGVWLACLVYGLVAAMASRLAERWFGGYLVGSALVYTALFQILWGGNCFEFVVSPVVWSFVIMAMLFFAGRAGGWIVRSSEGRR